MGKPIVLTMPPAEILYRLAQRAKEQSKALSFDCGPDSNAEHLNFVGNGFLRANEGRAIEA